MHLIQRNILNRQLFYISMKISLIPYMFLFILRESGIEISQEWLFDIICVLVALMLQFFCKAYYS